MSDPKTSGRIFVWVTAGTEEVQGTETALLYELGFDLSALCD
jgi:hypothetical protein